MNITSYNLRPLPNAQCGFNAGLLQHQRMQVTFPRHMQVEDATTAAGACEKKGLCATHQRGSGIELTREVLEVVLRAARKLSPVTNATSGSP